MYFLQLSTPAAAVLDVISLCLLMGVVVDAQFQLSFGTPAPAVPTTPRPTLAGGYDPACKDAIKDCKNYGQDSCKGVYLTWAQKNCEATCGFCRPLPTQPPPCVDALPNCADFETSTCTSPTYRPWAEENCRKYCRLCSASQLNSADALTTMPTTLPPSLCVDKVDCTLYGQDACNVNVYGTWGQENCPKYCGICQGIATPPPLCADKSPSCSLYQSDLCSNAGFDAFVKENCLKFCNRC